MRLSERVKHEHVKLLETNPGVWDWLTRSMYALSTYCTSAWSTGTYRCVTIPPPFWRIVPQTRLSTRAWIIQCNESVLDVVRTPDVIVRRYVGFHPLKPSLKNLEKDSPYVYLCSLGMRVFIVLLLRLSCSLSTCKRLPTVAGFSESSPSDFEFHGRSAITVTSVAEDWFYDELLFVLSTVMFGPGRGWKDAGVEERLPLTRSSIV